MPKKRNYQSDLRQQQADQTRAKIRKTARKLFEKKGFAATTVAEIARKAGVAAPTVYAAFESKAGIVAAMLEELEESAGIAKDVGQLFEEETAERQLEAWLATHCRLFTSGRDVLRAAVEASHADASALKARGDARRRELLDTLAQQWGKEGALATGLTPTRAAEEMWLLSTVESYLTAVDELGWTPAQYQQWLLALLRERILR